jgi:hypothetical protein
MDNDYIISTLLGGKPKFIPKLQIYTINSICGDHANTKLGSRHTFKKYKAMQRSCGKAKSANHIIGNLIHFIVK